jgi:hypothetical protein
MSKYQYQDISELRARMLAEIEQYYRCRNEQVWQNTVEFQEGQLSTMLDQVLAQVELECK